MIALFLAALLSSNGSGRTLVRTNPGTTVTIAGAAVLAYFPFSTPGCYASGSAMGTKGETITVVRASIATYLDAAGATQTCQANEARVGCDPAGLSSCGLINEVARTNYVLNSGTHPKTTQATASLPTGSYTAWHSGTGTMTLVNGTATTSGLSCSTVAAGTLCKFTVSVAGTMTITTTSGTTFAQVENGPYRTSGIATAGASAARAADSISATNPLAATNPRIWCIDATVFGSAAFGDGTDRTFMSTGGSANQWFANPVFGFAVYDAAASLKNAQPTSPPTLPVKLGIELANGSNRWVTNGASLAQTVTGSTGIQASQTATLWIGSYDNGTQNLGAFIRDLRISRATCR